jgi:hypothetical protein
MRDLHGLLEVGWVDVLSVEVTDGGSENESSGPEW